MNDIVMKSNENVCEDTGKKWVRNCPQCNKELIYSSKYCFREADKKNSLCHTCSLPRSNSKEFIEKAVKKHGGKFDYSNFVYKSYHVKGAMICKECKRGFMKSPAAHLRGEGCPFCSGKTKSNIKQFATKSNKIHGNGYDYSSFIYINNHTKGKIKCKKCNYEFLQTPNDHLDGCGCPKCGGHYRRTSGEIINEFKDIHGNMFDYSKVKYKDLNSKIDIICRKCSKSFLQKPQKHLDGQGCPFCDLSHGEVAIQKFLDRKGIKYIQQKTFSDCKNPKTGYNLRFDFYIPSKNLLIEYDGKQHFEIGCLGGRYFMSVKDLDYIKYKDNLKTEYSQNNGINLLRISYKKINDIDKILENRLLV